ncbi:DEAD/DEAH box helicase [Neptuniibacter sp.]|uniref:DEAD/DEAH box helicase n=1 Tax=Neptuniibacter sp. TaxID=1962643 RepID=UPI0026139B6A|nr:DEAD/DEAH box helicase [Neptuniibacter sp.]MCP4595241.1 DEAD/DEAH box helicase [Neptuniibacter sp.]
MTSKNFSDLPLCPELQFTLQELGYKKPTPIQEKAIPLVMEGHDLLAEAQTGTGKTASFALPIIEKLSKKAPDPKYRSIRALVLVPTRELAIQVADNTLEYGRALSMRVTSVYGGVRVENQVRKLKRGTDILVATPGRLLDLLQQKAIDLESLEFMVLDEADRMLDLGFIEPIKQIMDYAAEPRQTLLFSATADESTEVLAEFYLNDPKKVRVATRNSTSHQVKQFAYAVDNSDKADVLSYLISEGQWGQALVFVRTKKRVDELVQYLQREKIDAGAIHGDKSQRERIRMLDEFMRGDLQILVATDVAARGLDIDALPMVVNYDVPNVPEDYVHRIGRTGRAGEMGQAVSLVAPVEKEFLNRIEKLIKQKIKLRPVPRVEDGQLIESEFVATKSKKRKVKSKGKVAKRQTVESYQKDDSIKSVRPSPFGNKFGGDN